MTMFFMNITGGNASVDDSQSLPAGSQIYLKYAQFDPLVSLPAIPDTLMSHHSAIPDARMPYIIQTHGPITEDWREELAHNGVEIISYIPDNAYLVRLSDDQVEMARGLGGVRWLGEYHPAYKMDPTLTLGGGTVDLSVTLFPDATNAYVVKLLRTVGAEILGAAHNDDVNIVKLRIDSSFIDVLASMPEVRFISLWEPASILNDSTTQFVQSGSISGGWPIFTRGIDGKNQIIAIGDSGVNVNHQNFDGLVYGPAGNGPKILGYYVPGDSIGILGDEASLTYHGSFVAGTALGDGPTYGAYTPTTYDGHAFMAQLVMEDIGCPDDPGTSNIDEGAFIWTPSDMYNDYFGSAESIYGAKIHSSSWGGGLGYEEETAIIDKYIWDSQDYNILFPTGGNGPIASTIAKQAEAKNIITVGSLTEIGTAVSTYSSRGPTADGRIKPDVMAPGEIITSVNGGSTNTYTVMSGTSGACPAVAGSAALVRQYYEEGWYPTGTKMQVNSINPSAALVKATLINGANPLGQIPNMNEGWGRVHLENSLYFPGDTIKTAVVDNQIGLLTNDYAEYQYSVAAGQRLKISLVWTDYEGDPAASKMLVNDLNLLVTVPGGTQYRGNVFSNGWSITGGSNDTLNNVECVNIAAPTAGIYTIRVTGASIALGLQNFAMVASGDLVEGYGNVFMDRTVYDEMDTISVDVEDTNNSAGSVSVTVTTSSGDSETVSVPGTGTDSGLFRGGTIATELGVIATGDGALQVFHGDVVTATYADSSPAHDSHAYANVDFRGPVITNVYADGILPTAAVIHWDTNENANSVVYYGSTTSLGSTSTVTALAINHKVVLKDLAPGTIYFYDVESRDSRGRSVRDDNGGEHYVFSTGSAGAGGNLVLLVDDDDGTTSPLSGTPFELDWMNNLNSYGWTYTHWDFKVYGTPSLADMNSHTMVVWFVAEGYPQIGASDRAVLGEYLDQAVTPMGTRPMLFLSGQDIGWDMCDAVGTDRNVAWFQMYTKTQYMRDDADGGGGTEVGSFQVENVGHPLSMGLADIDLEVEAYEYPVMGYRFWPDDLTLLTGGTETFDYSAHAGGGNCAGASQSGGGTGGQARIVYHGFSHDMISSTNVGTADYNPEVPQIDNERSRMLDQIIQWLLGGNHPTIGLTYPTGGESESGNISISWQVTGANSIDVYYSANGGQAWTPLVTGLAGAATSYTWNAGNMLTGNNYRVKIVAYSVATYATLTDYSESGVFSISGVDYLGPKCVAGSVTADKEPTIKGDTMWFNATVTDDGRGQSNMNAAEFFIDMTGANGTGTAMTATDGIYNSITEAVIATYTGSGSLSSGPHTLFVHGKDACENWGPFASTTFHIIATTPMATATGPIGGPYNVVAVTITYTYANSPTSVNLYYTTNSGTTWTFAGNDADVDGSYDYTIMSGSGSYGWIASAVGSGSDEPSPPATGFVPEAALYILDLAPPEAPTSLTVHHFGWHTMSGSETLTTADTTAAGGPHNVWFTIVDSNADSELTMPNSVVEFTDLYYTNAATSNDVRAGPSSQPPLSDEEFVKCQFATAVDPDLVTQINLTFEGYFSGACTATIYAYNIASSVWNIIGSTQAFVTGSDSVMTRTITSSPGDYISGGYILWGIYDETSRQSASVDYLEVTIEYSTIIGTLNDNTLNWTHDGTGVNLFNIYRASTQFGAYSFIDTVPLGTNTYCDIGMGQADSTVWWYKVRAEDAFGNEEENDNAISEPFPPPPYEIDLTGKPANSWVFISFPIEISGNIQDVLNDATVGDGLTAWTVAKWYNPQTPADPWKSYRVGGTANDMPTITNAMGIWLWITANGGDQRLTTGLGCNTPIEPVNINLYAGWNMVGYPSLTERSVGDAFWGTGADRVEVFDPALPYIIEAGPDYIMKPGEGFWVHVMADTVWTVDW
ncbi:MAG: S8 family serine peptidase [Thermoplasmata archaeon]|nr:S8 family serine peptidase [Thermoplasmata archaeon]